MGCGKRYAEINGNNRWVCWDISAHHADRKRRPIPHGIRQRRSRNIGEKDDYLFNSRAFTGNILIRDSLNNHQFKNRIKMKKINKITTLIITLALAVEMATACFITTAAFGTAVATAASTPTGTSSPGTSATKTKDPLDELLPTQLDKSLEGTKQSYGSELENYSNLHKEPFEQIAASAIKTVLFLAGSLVIIGLLVVGAMYLTGSMNEESSTKAKKILGYLGIGIIIISVSYAIVAAVLKVNLF